MKKVRQPLMTCYSCKTEKPCEAFRPYQGRLCAECDRARCRQRRKDNPEATRARDRAYHVANRERHLDNMRRRNYGITGDAFRAMLAAQGNRCAICQRAFSSAQRRGPHVDHCHESNVVRSLLCTFCNVGLGAFGEDTERMRAAIDYIHMHRTLHLRSA